MFLTCKLKAYCSYVLEFCFLYSSASFPLKYFYLILCFPFSTMMTFSYHRGMCFMGSHLTLPDPNCYKAPSLLVPLCLVQMSIVNPYGGFCAFGMLPSQPAAPLSPSPLSLNLNSSCSDADAIALLLAWWCVECSNTPETLINERVFPAGRSACRQWMGGGRRGARLVLEHTLCILPFTLSCSSKPRPPCRSGGGLGCLGGAKRRNWVWQDLHHKLSAEC